MTTSRLAARASRISRVASRAGRSVATRTLRPLGTPGRGRPLWVFGGTSGQEYADNGRVLYEYVLDRRPDVDAVWLIDADSPDRAEVAAAGAWLDRESLAAHRATSAADVLVFSHGIHDVAGLYANRRAVVVRLGHGLTAFGLARGSTPLSTRRLVGRVDLAPVASELERSHKLQWGFGAEQLPITGLARWDVMRRLRRQTPAAARDVLLFAPTWRRWLTKDPIEGSHYWRHVVGLLQQDWLHRVLDETGLRLAVFFHPTLRAAIDGLGHLGELCDPGDGRRIEHVARGKQVPEVLSRTALFLTDYSSLSFDGLHLGIPVAFYQFDLDRYLAERGAYVDLRSGLFGPTAVTDHELRSVLEQFAASGGTFPTHEGAAADWAAKAFAFDDEDNCKRVVEAIEHRLAATRTRAG